MALKIIDHGTKEYQQMVKLREDILRKPLGFTFSPEELDSEKDNILIAAFEDDRILGCCMLVEEKPGSVRLRQMAVLIYREKALEGPSCSSRKILPVTMATGPSPCMRENMLLVFMKK